MAVERLQAAGATHFLFAGDACDLRVLDQLAGLPSSAVAGNCDRRLWRALPSYCATLGIAYGEVSVELELAGKRLLLAHGDPRTEEAIRSAEIAGFDFVLRGHEHVQADWTHGSRPTRHLIPGSVAEPRDADGRARCMTLDVVSGRASWITLP